MRSCLTVLAMATSAAAAGPHMMKATKRTRSFKTDRMRVVKHLQTLLARAPEEHKAAIQTELDSTDDFPEIDSWYGYPDTLDWIVDLYFDASDDATAYPVILDSGSSNLAIATSGCTNCGEASTTLNLTLSSDPSMCIEVTYGSGSWSGYEAESTYVGLSSSVSTTTTLAAITDQDDFFEGGSSYVGILGMAYDGIANDYYSSLCTSDDDASTAASSSTKARNGVRSAPRLATATSEMRSSSSSSGTSDSATPLLYALATAGAIESNSFAVLMCGDDATVSIGGVAESMYTGDINYATTQETFGEYYGYYLIYTTAVTVGTESVSVTDINKYGGLVVDTGTTLHYLPSATVTAIETEVKSSVTSVDKSFFEWESCVDSDVLSDFPDITYTFASSDDDDATTFDVVLTAEHYLLKYDSCYYWGFESSSLGIFGNIGMKAKAMVFDIDNNRIGIATGVCGGADDDDDDDDDSSSTKSLFRKAGKAAGAFAEQSAERITSGGHTSMVMAAVAAAGLVVASAFVVVKKLAVASKKSAPEQEALLPPL